MPKVVWTDAACPEYDAELNEIHLSERGYFPAIVQLIHEVMHWLLCLPAQAVGRRDSMLSDFIYLLNKFFDATCYMYDERYEGSWSFWHYLYVKPFLRKYIHLKFF